MAAISGSSNPYSPRGEEYQEPQASEQKEFVGRWDDVRRDYKSIKGSSSTDVQQYLAQVGTPNYEKLIEKRIAANRKNE